LITSAATTVGTPASAAALARLIVPTLLQSVPSRNTVSAPISRTVASAMRPGASVSSSSSTSCPASRSSSAKARPSPTGSDTVQKTFFGACR
jgi:hypothetical protein